ncbi:MAG: pseudouridine synthase [Candidatus Dojkabacteria bacterium]|nr:MAG: pseudouridine synthase [Candidatus Dojkabacteria bacterium]
MKVHVYLRNLGIASRRKGEEMIREGRVLVDGKPAIIGQQVVGNEQIQVDGRVVITTEQKTQYRYLMLNKPRGFTSTTATHFRNEQSLLELLPSSLRSIPWQIVGRLDKESQGLVLLTTDGGLGFALTHPKFEIRKIYQVTTSRALTEEEMRLLQGGVLGQSGEWYRFYSIKRLSREQYECILTEGKKREIREALAVFGVSVTQLQRVGLGTLRIGNLPEGSYRELTLGEIAQLKAESEN